MSDHKYSDPMIYDNSIHPDDDPSGFDGGYDRHGNYINSAAMMDLVGLRKELAELREAAQGMADAMGRGEDRELVALGKLEAALQEKGE